MDQESFELVSPRSEKSWIDQLYLEGVDWSSPKPFKMNAIVLWRGTDWYSSTAEQTFHKTNLRTVKQQDDFIKKLITWKGNLGYNGFVGRSKKEVFIPDKLLAKTSEFGSTGGSGAGAAQTDLGESAQCVYLASVQYNKHKITNDIQVAKNINRYRSMFDITAEEEKVLTGMGLDWIESSTKIANLWPSNSLFKKYLKTNKNYVFHRGSDMVDVIYNKFKILNKNLDPPFANENKWSPADIWAIESSINKAQLINDMNKLQSMEELNQYLLKKINAGMLVGMSLKKAERIPHMDLFNMGEKPRQIKYTGYQIRATNGKIWDAKDAYILFEIDNKPMKQQLRTFDTAGFGWQTEIKGSFANLGKLSQGPINLLLEANGFTTLTPTIKVKAMATDPTKHQDMIKDMYTWYSNLETNSQLDQDEFVKMTTDYAGGEGTRWRYSKYYGFQLLNIIKDKAQKFVQEEILYAMSNSKYSAPFIKLS